MKRIISLLLTVMVLVCVVGVPAFATDNSRNYDFELTIDDKVQTEAAPGQIVSVSLVLKRTDSKENAPMYGMQAELEYDDTFLELVEGSVMTASGVKWTDMARRTGGRAFYLNFLSTTGGEMWAPETIVGVYQFKVLGDTGVSTLAAVNCLVSTADGTDSFQSTCNDAKVIVSTECTVTFVSNGGSDVESQKVQYGEKIKEPEEPTREGYTFNGWYSDLDRTQLWDFKNDTVKGNMTLYAGWIVGDNQNSAHGGAGFASVLSWRIIALCLMLIILLILILLLIFGRKKITFNSRGGTKLEPIYVRKGKTIETPINPVKAGALFCGWYCDPECTKPWNFETDVVKNSMTLYARWI